MSEDGSMVGAGELSRVDARQTAEVRHALFVRLAVAAAVFLVSLVFYGVCLFPGLGGELNAGDSAKFQILGHTPIMVHGPGYPIVLMLGAVLRTLDLPLEPWWALTFALSAVPASIANAMAFLIAERVSRSLALGVATALLLGTAGLMAIQATEAEVYALALAFILSITFCLILFVETRDVRYFLAACAIYALSFGNHLMMIMLVSLFLGVTVFYRDIVVTVRNVAIVAGFVLVGASQYLYLAWVAYDPATSYSEYMPLPPTPVELIEYILGLYFSDLYGSGAASTRTAEALMTTIRSSHSYLSLPLILAGIAAFLAGWKPADAAWRGLAVAYGAALSFVPFAIWYGAYDIQAFHLPVLGPLLVATGASLSWWVAGRGVLVSRVAAALLLAAGVVRAGQTASYLTSRTPIYEGLPAELEEIVAQSPVENPLVMMPYGIRMATLYHELLDGMPGPATYRVSWRAVTELAEREDVGGLVVPTDGNQFVRWIEHYRPDLACRTWDLELSDGARWAAYAFECD